MSLKGNLEAEVEVKTDAKTIHDVFSCRPHHISNMTPEKIQGVDLHEGDLGTPGTVLIWNYVHEGVPKIAKEVVEAIDDVNLSTTFKVIEGDLLTEFKDFKATVKATPKANGEGAIAHWHFEYEKLHEGIPDPHSLLEFTIHMTKDIDDHHMSLKGNLEAEVEIKTDAKTFHELFSCRPHDISKMSPHKIQGAELQRDLGTAAAKLTWHYVQDGIAKYDKEVVEAIDDVNLSITLRVIEGVLMEEYKYFITTIKATPKDNGEGSIVHWNCAYERLHEGIPDPHSLLQYAVEMTKDIDDYHGIIFYLEKRMSLKGNLEAEVEIKTDAKTFHDVFSARPHHISNMTPERVQGVDLHEGDLGTAGTVLVWNYVHEGVPKIAKVIDGDLVTEFKDYKATVKATPKANGEGATVHWHIEYEKLHEGIPDPHPMHARACYPYEQRY
ncbi:hypothetical protein Tsubulata_021424 [Turnera subulata]|uniref:Bet v I/Major latex protein domain-containing protein n=1 Tax=Turnera subulata TaxID=218843 RepID=A0A9Q0FZ59_9ROSI|nr:hypothetical protein Tsubulata_021424 [Turnera subulata]